MSDTFFVGRPALRAILMLDFRKHREHKPETLEQIAVQIFDGINLPDTAPCEMIPYLAPEEDLA